MAVAAPSVVVLVYDEPETTGVEAPEELPVPVEDPDETCHLLVRSYMKKLSCVIQYILVLLECIDNSMNSMAHRTTRIHNKKVR